ncbi:hypothetical protein IE53DRAFT_109386 [Violaceomyces palustris]|uniref:Uncharacterized protein n=1 Tax=Violaceomyces palustris TaxID=1673888 RepID=A0ACD0NWB1_9BASI|nr:hypothetical protein IE53DRAFT_109386 [Violaceomyces palustris]
MDVCFTRWMDGFEELVGGGGGGGSNDDGDLGEMMLVQGRKGQRLRGMREGDEAREGGRRKRKPFLFFLFFLFFFLVLAHESPSFSLSLSLCVCRVLSSAVPILSLSLSLSLLALLPHSLFPFLFLCVPGSVLVWSGAGRVEEENHSASGEVSHSPVPTHW